MTRKEIIGQQYLLQNGVLLLLLQLLALLGQQQTCQAWTTQFRTDSRPDRSLLHHESGCLHRSNNPRLITRLCGQDHGQQQQQKPHEPGGYFQSSASENEDAEAAIKELLSAWKPPPTASSSSEDTEQEDVAFLFVGQYHAGKFSEIVQSVQDGLQSVRTSNVVAVLGGGVIGGGSEMDNAQEPSISLLRGRLPPHGHARVFACSRGESKDEIQQHISEAVAEDNNPRRRPPSYLVFADPFSPLDEVLAQLDNVSATTKSESSCPVVVAGGISVPQVITQSTVAWNGKVLPPGSLVGVALTGTVGLLAVVAQGCRPVGPTFVITQATKNVLTGLSSETAISCLEDVAEKADEADQELIRNGEVVCGISYASLSKFDKNKLETEEEEMMVKVEDDFLIRQIMGFQPKSGSIVVAGGDLHEGDTFRFHVRAATSAKEDMDLMIQRAKTERLFLSSGVMTASSSWSHIAKPGTPMAALQISCVARGKAFFGSSNADLSKVQELFQTGTSGTSSEAQTYASNDDVEEIELIRQPAPPARSPIAGFFANGEIGPVGVRMTGVRPTNIEDAEGSGCGGNTFLHGFTTVVAMLCDYSAEYDSGSFSGSQVEELASNSIISSMDDAWA